MPNPPCSLAKSFPILPSSLFYYTHSLPPQRNCLKRDLSLETIPDVKRITFVFTLSIDWLHALDLKRLWSIWNRWES
jgi:hypothetical protein